jgi:hypothetical protein
MTINFLPSNPYPAFDELTALSNNKKNTATSKVQSQLSGSTSLRQGVELRTIDDIYTTTQPKFWSGEILKNGTLQHGFSEEKILGIGQPLSHTATKAEPSFIEKEIKFDPVAFISNKDYYPFPIQLNLGLPNQKSNIIEPLTIPFRLNNLEFNYFSKGIHGSVDCGPKEGLNKGNQKISQFKKVDTTGDSVNAFLDSGQDTIGGITRQGYSNNEVSRELGFIEKDNNNDIVLLTSTSIEFKNVLKTLDYSRDEDIRKEFNIKSMPAGNDIYSSYRNIAGTDSIAYTNRLKGY